MAFSRNTYELVTRTEVPKILNNFVVSICHIYKRTAFERYPKTQVHQYSFDNSLRNGTR